jgi:hypothetical protein
MSELVVSPQQVTFFKTFGYLALPGLFADDMADIEAAFEEVWANDTGPRMEMEVDLHKREPRTIIPGFTDKHPLLLALRTDPRITSVADALIGTEREFADSDGNLAWCDSDWHADEYGAPMEIQHLKLSFYLDPLRADSGAIRIIPGTHHWQESFARSIRSQFRTFGRTREVFGVESEEIPSIILNSDPGDVLVWDYRTIHASFNGQDRRRFFSLNFRVPAAAPDADRATAAAGVGA